MNLNNYWGLNNVKCGHSRKYVRFNNVTSSCGIGEYSLNFNRHSTIALGCIKMINLELSVQEINLILQALGQAPYVQVADIIDKVRTQAAPQVEALPKEDIAE